MKDTSDQTGPEADKVGESSQLTDRMLARHSKPIGVIDVRRAEQHYSRTAGWVAERFALLDHWKSRYDVDEGRGAGGSLVFSSAPREAPTRTSSGPTLSNMAQIARSAKPVASPPSGSPQQQQQYRVRRRGAETTSAPGAADSRPGQPTPPLPSTVAIPNDGPPTRSERQVLHSAGPKAPMIMREALKPSPGETARSSGSLDRINVEPVTRITPDPPATVPSRGESGASLVAVQRPPLGHSEPRTTPVVRGESAAPAAAPQPLRLQSTEPTLRRVTESRSPASARPALDPLGSGRVVQRTAVEIPTSSELSGRDPQADSPVQEQRDHAAGHAIPPLVSPSAGSTLIQRRTSAGNAQNLHADDAVKPAQPPAPAAVPVARPDAPKSEMVWRKGNDVDASATGVASSPGISRSATGAMPLAVSRPPQSSTTLFRQTEIARVAEPAAGTSVEAAPAQATPAAASTGQVDIAQLAERVGRLISRELAVERERRGIK